MAVIAPVAGNERVVGSRAQTPLSLLALAAYCVALWWVAPDSSGFATSTSARLALLGAVLAFAAVAGTGRGRWLGAAGVYLIVFTLFHLGLAPMLAMGWDVPDFDNRGRVPWWLENRPVGPALFVVAVAIAAYAIGVRIGNRFGARSRLRPASSLTIAPDDERRVAGVALVITTIGVLGWIGFTANRGGISIFFSSYADYREATENGLLPILYVLISLGVALCAVAPRHQWSRWGFWLVGIFAFLAVLLGLRGEILFPAAAAVVVLHKRGRINADPVRWIVLGIVLLSLISGVRSLRATGVSEGGFSLDLNPLHGAVELGHSLRPTAEVINWQNDFADLAGGRTYVRPIERLASRALPIDLPSANEDPYVMNAVMRKRVGSIGFSPVAEGYENWGTAGAAGYMLVVGTLLGYLDRRPTTVSGLVATVVVLVPLLIQTRNSFVPVPLNLAIGVAVWVAVFRPRHASAAPEALERARA